MKDREQPRRMLLKISTAVMISIVGPASAWSVAQESGLMLYILAYMTSKHISSYVASRSTQIAIFSYRHAPLLLVLSGLLSLLPGSLLTFAIIMPFLLGCYEGAYWAVYFDYKPWFKARKRKRVFLSKIQIGLEAILRVVTKAKLTSVPFAICQFVLSNSMRFVALERSLMAGGIGCNCRISLVFDSDFLSRITQNQPACEDSVGSGIGQIVVLLGIMMMVLGHSIELFILFLIGRFIFRDGKRMSSKNRDSVVSKSPQWQTLREQTKLGWNVFNERSHRRHVRCCFSNMAKSINQFDLELYWAVCLRFSLSH